MPYHKIIQNFNAGELSPFLANRTDVAKYESGCQTLENMILLPYGGVMRRPGTQWLGAAKFADKPCRLMGFNFSVTTNFVLEFGEFYVRFWTNGIPVVTPISSYTAWVTTHSYVVGDRVRAGTPEKVYVCKIAHSSVDFAADLAAGKWEHEHPVLEKITPYPATKLRQIQYCQINDIMYLTHPEYPLQKLTRVADDNWTFAEVAFKWPPLQDENIQNITITPSSTGGDITLTASAALFEAGDVGSTWQVGHNMAGQSQTYVEVALEATSNNSPAIRVRGPWSFTTYGTWQGEIRIHRTIYRTGVAEYIRTWRNNAPGQRNISSTGTEDEDCSMYIAFFTHGVAGSSTPMARLEFSNAAVYGLVKITGYSSPTVVQGTVAWGLAHAAATTRWSQPAFSQRWGYARTACLHEQRLCLGGSRKKPLSIHGSQIDDFENFQRGALADHAFLFNLSANESNPINWMLPQTKLLIGTAGNEWSMGATNEEQSLGPGNVQARQQSSFGSSFLQARVVNEVILFAQRQGHKIRELVYSFQKDGWVAPDLCILASHISDDGFAETAFAQQPDAIFWSVTSRGNLVGMTYERDQNVVGWHRHSTQGTFESVASIYGGDKADEIWFSIKRSIDGEDVRYIERFDPNFRPTLEAEDKEHYWYLDSAFRSGGSTKVSTVSGIGHLEGCTVGVLGDGANQPTRVVTAGAVNIQEPAKTILVGLPYASTVKPMNLNIPMQDTMQGRKVRIHKLVVRFYKSLTCKFSSDELKWDEIFFRDREDKMDASPSVFTGDREVHTGAKFNPHQAISLRQDRPFPLCVLAMVYWADSYGE